LAELRRVCKPDGESASSIIVSRPAAGPGAAEIDVGLAERTFAATYTPTTESYFDEAGLVVIEEKIPAHRRAQDDSAASALRTLVSIGRIKKGGCEAALYVPILAAAQKILMNSM